MQDETITTDYLARYDAAPEEQKFPLVRKWMDKEPLPFFKELRAKRPILVTPECTLVAYYDDIIRILNMPTIFTVSLYVPKMNGNYLMCHDGDALHYREKSLMQGFLNKEDLPDVRRMVAESAKNILDQANGQIEIVNNYCRMVPCALVQDYFGLTGVEREDLIRWSFWNQYNTFHNQPFDIISDAKRKEIVDSHAKSSDELVKYMALLIARKLFAVKIKQAENKLLIGWYLLVKLFRKLTGKQDEELGDDITSRMLSTNFPDAMDFGLQRVATNAGGLLIGAIETTAQAVAQVIQYFIDHPDLHQRAKNAAQLSDTDQFDALVWEALRFVPISPYLFRTAAEDYTIAKGTGHETQVDAGTNVLLLTQSGMFDPKAYTNPDKFDPDRDWYHNFNYGYGEHECLGKYVGMVMIPEMVRQVMLRQGLEANSPIDYKDGPFPEDYPLTWTG
jgi:cytochrome P450